ncbi:hypothetical protein V5O48_003094 [Marasmius crinis-equi]|uniref:Uncharacterized protein n=1 Tax=Marasmius crinis-equi TaxID=585013 RepID=A0ABR3FTU6_9AGAR
MDGEYLGELKDFVKASISRWEAFQHEIKASPKSREIFGVDWLSALSQEVGKEPKRDLDFLLRLAEERGISGPQIDSLWTWERFPITIRQAGLALPARVQGSPQDALVTDPSDIQDDELVANFDEWILRNEAYLRFLARKCGSNHTSKVRTWTFGLVRIAQLPAVLTLPHDISTKRIAISRPESLPGFCVLGDKRGSKILVQPSQAAFDSSWSQMTGGVLQGLDWSNVFAAGGSVLGALITPEVGAEEIHEKKQWLSSDIDLYVCGLTIHEANKKVEYITRTYQGNLPHGTPFVATRNSQTVTLYSSWPTKRVQIILKLVNNPCDVLLNFDLDSCAVGYDGSNVWMLPRFVRSLETGYNTFTMDLIRGHYLDDRKATRDERVFKYASKGFGVRVLPSYISQCGDLEPTLALMNSVANESRQWTSRFIDFHRSWKFFFNKKHTSSDQDSIPEFSFSQLYMNDPKPMGGSLSSFALFMRHVALWEQDVLHKISIRDDLVTGKEEGDEAYYERDPSYQWTRDFNIPKFCDHLDDYNQRLTAQVEEVAEYILFQPRHSLVWSGVKRVTYSPSASGVLSEDNDLVLPVVMPKEMIHFANELILDSLQEHGVKRMEPPLRIVYEDETQWLSKGLCLATWNIDTVLNWQILDRKIDE